MTELEKNLRAGLFWLTDEEKAIRDAKIRTRKRPRKISMGRKKPQGILQRHKYWISYYKANSQKIKARNAEWRKRNPERVKILSEQWAKKHPEKKRASVAKRHALKMKAAVNLAGIKEFMASVASRKSVKCYYCKQNFSPKKIHYDHIIPLTKGGPHSVENLCVSCPSCNLSKHDKTPQAWIKIGQQFLAL